MPLDAALKARWLAALRGGRYRQGRGKLRPTDDTYCCLGVLCDVSGLGEWHKDPVKRWEFVLKDKRDAWRSWGFSHVPDMMQAMVGLTTSMQDSLVNMNDDGKSFAEIADHIERNG